MLSLIQKVADIAKCVRFKTTRMERVQMSYDSEALVAKNFKGQVTAHRDPIDVVTGTHGIEVKAFHKRTKVHKIRTEKDAVIRKKKFCKDRKLKEQTIMAVVNDFVELYEKEGFGNFRKKNMTYIGKYKRPK